MDEQVDTGAKTTKLRNRYWQEYGKPPEGQGPHPDSGGPAYIPWLEKLVTELARGIVVYRDALRSANLGANVEIHEENILSEDTAKLCVVANDESRE